MFLNLDHLFRTANTLDQAVTRLAELPSDQDPLFDLFRNATLKLLPEHLQDVRALAVELRKLFDAQA